MDCAENLYIFFGVTLLVNPNRYIETNKQINTFTLLFLSMCIFYIIKAINYEVFYRYSQIYKYIGTSRFQNNV